MNSTAPPAQHYFHAFSGAAAGDEEVEDVPELSNVGGKAQALVESTRGGFNVPQGFVLSVEFFKPWMKKIQEESKEWTSFAEWFDKQTSSQEDISDNIAHLNKKIAELKYFCNTNLSLAEAQLTCLDEAIQSTFRSKSNAEPQGGEDQLEVEASNIRL
jgi:phosphoenolpyruvate synthase/pyruvate phosphate dikinase